MTDSQITSPDAATSVVDPEQPPQARTCPGCGAVYSEEELANADYRCKQCGLEIAHVETSANGATRRVLAWLRQPGEKLLGRYTIEKILGKGGFATTYLVEDSRLNGRKRALKEIPKPLYDDLEEAMLSQLNHPAIPDIVDRGETDDTIYLVLKFGGGRTLETERKNRGGRIPLDVLMPWFQQLGDVISYLHSQTPPVIHRDLKPDNVLLDERDHVMLIDFGIAKQTEDGGQTRTIARAATHGYSPPEQALGTGTDPRSDVYALAATAYTLLTGRVPPPAHIRVAGRELESPAQLVPELPTNVSDALVDALNLNINLRPQSVLELMQRFTGQTSPVADFGQTESRTVMVGDLPANYSDAPTSVRIGTENVTIQAADSAPKKSSKGLWATILLLIAAGGVGGWLYLDQLDTGKDDSSSRDTAVERHDPAPDPVITSENASETPLSAGTTADEPGSANHANDKVAPIGSEQAEARPDSLTTDTPRPLPVEPQPGTGNTTQQGAATVMPKPGLPRPPPGAVWTMARPPVNNTTKNSPGNSAFEAFEEQLKKAPIASVPPAPSPAPTPAPIKRPAVQPSHTPRPKRTAATRRPASNSSHHHKKPASSGWGAKHLGSSKTN